MVTSIQQMLSQIPYPVQYAIFGEEVLQIQIPEMRIIEAVWRETGTAFADLARQVRALAADSPISGEHVATTSFHLADALQQHSEFCCGVADQVGHNTTESEKSLAEMILSAVMTFYQVMAMATNGATSLFALGKLAEARKTYLAMLDVLVAKLGLAGAEAAAARAGLVLVGQTLGFASLNASMDYGIQAVQVLSDDRDAIDWQAVAAMAAMGAGGTVGGHLGGAAAQAVGRNITSPFLTAVTRYIVPVAAGITGVVGGAAAAGSITGHFDITELGAAMFNGAALGLAGARAVTTKAEQTLVRPDIVEPHLPAPDPRPETATPASDTTTPDPATASHRELAEWAAGLDNEQARRIMAEQHASATAQLAAFRRGEPPPLPDMIATARTQNAVLWEQTRRFMENDPVQPDSIVAGPELDNIARHLATRVPEAAELSAAADNVYDIVGALPADAPGGAPPRNLGGGPHGRLNFMHYFPEHLGRMADMLARPARTHPGSEGQADVTEMAVDQVANLTNHIDMARSRDRTDWSEQVDEYLVARSRSDFDPELVRALRSLTTAEAAFAGAQTGTDREFAAAAAPYLENLATATRYYLTRTRDPETAMDLVRRTDTAFAATSARLQQSQPAKDAARAINDLHTSLRNVKFSPSVYELPQIQRGHWLDQLEGNAALPEVVQRLDRMSRSPEPEPEPVDTQPDDADPTTVSGPESERDQK